MAKQTPLIIGRWATQAGRRRPALAPGYVGIDERSFAELMAFAPAFGRHVRYIGPDNQPDGDWSAFFLADGAMVQASIAVFDAAGHSRRFHAALAGVHGDHTDAMRLVHLQDVFDIILSLPQDVDAWYGAVTHLPDAPRARALRSLLASAIRGELAPLLAELRGYAAGAGQPGALGHAFPLDCRHFHSIWQTEFLCPRAAIFQGHFRRQKMLAALGPLTALYDTLLGAVTDLADHARRDVDASFAEGPLKPHIALYAAFVHQFREAQTRLNTLPSRVVDFYYHDVLREARQPPVADRVFLTFTRTPGITPARVPRGTPFPAGADPSGLPIIFTADHALDVTRAQLMQVRTLRTIRGPLLGRAGPPSLNDRPLRVLAAEIAIGTNGMAADGHPWAPFGDDTSGPAAAPAPVGFAVASPLLRLAGGQRAITLTLQVDPASLSMLDPQLAAIAEATGLAVDQALDQIAAAAFDFAGTTASGWHALVPLHAAASSGPNGRTFSFHFELPPEAPALAPLAPPAITPGNSPALQARLRQQPVALAGPAGTAQVYPLSLLDGLAIATITLETTVTGLPGVTVRTLNGPVDATVPFLPFGAPARAGAWFEIQHPETATKPLDKLVLTLNWLGLPAHPNGFAGHYAQYVVGPDRVPGGVTITNESFRIAASVHGDAPWSLAAPSPLWLFRTADNVDKPEAAVPLRPTTTITLAPEPLARGPSQPAGAALRITLSEPPYGFGDELYAPNVLHALHAIQAPPPPRPWLCRVLDLILLRTPPAPTLPDVAQLYPNPPWQPEIATLSVDYHATETLDLHGNAAQTFLHLLPTGVLAPATRSPTGMALLPNSAPDAQLDLAFAGLGVAQQLTLLVRPSESGRGGGVLWQALGQNGWVDLADGIDCRDASLGLSQPGIVTLDLPTMGADAGPTRWSWLRVTPKGRPDDFATIAAITPHALTATRQLSAPTVALTPIPAKSIKAAAAPLAGVATIDQPATSFGGRPGETGGTLPIRLGERLRHKARAVLTWDHEHLVLERFPDIAKARVLAAGDGIAAAGELLAVVVPTSQPASPDPWTPRTPAELRGEIRTSLQQLTSPFARIQVVDPNYVRVRVQADVVFRPGQPTDGATRLIQDLGLLLSPGADGLDLSDDADADDVHVAVANFIASRSYVAGFANLGLAFAPPLATFPWCVLTSADTHDIRIAHATAVLEPVVPPAPARSPIAAPIPA